MKKLISIILILLFALTLFACGADEPEIIEYEPIELTFEEYVQQKANEEIIHFIRNAGFLVETSVTVLEAGFAHSDNGIWERMYLTVQAQTMGGGLATSDWWVVLNHFEGVKRIQSRDDFTAEHLRFNDYSQMEFMLDVRQLNESINNHWEDLGISR